jgi:hypothetical protein
VKKLLHIKEAHSFSITGLAINHDRSLLVSASAENKCRAVVLPKVYESSKLTIRDGIIASLISNICSSTVALEINPLLTVLIALVLVVFILLICNFLNVYLYK